MYNLITSLTFASAISFPVLDLSQAVDDDPIDLPKGNITEPLHTKVT